MGYTFEVAEWWRDWTEGEDYKYHIEYEGQSLLKAVWTMWKLKRDGAACLRFVWRPNN